MVVDTSALVAIAFLEPEYDAFARAIRLAPQRFVSAASAVELVAVLAGRWPGAVVIERTSRLLKQFEIAVLPVDEAQLWAAGEALLMYGKGRHPARLNLGDSFAYAAAKVLDMPLLFKGDDFSQTDIRPAV